MAANQLVKIATIEALVVLVLGIAVLTRSDEVVPSSQPDRAVGEDPATLGPPVESPEREVAESKTPASAPPVPLAAAPLEIVTASDPLGLVLHGTVCDQDGTPLTSWVVDLSSTDPGSSLQQRALGSDSSTWSMSGIPPGDYRVRCQARGCQTVDEVVTLSSSPRVQRRDFRLLRSLAITVRFDVPAEQRAALIHDRHAVLATAEELPERIPILPGGNIPFSTLGSWRPNYAGVGGKVHAGQIELQRAPPLYLSVFLGPIRLQSRHLAEMCDEITFTIDEQQLRRAVGGLRLRLIDASTGLPVVNAFVKVDDLGTSPNAQGVVEIGTLAPGQRDLTVWTQNRYAAVSRSIEIRGGERLDLGDIQLQASRSLRGTVVDESGQGVVAHVHVVSLRDPAAPVMSSVPYAQSREDGGFDLAGVGDGAHLVRAVLANRERMGWAIAENGTPAELRIVMQPTFPVLLTGKLAPYGECRATVRTAMGQALQVERLMGSSPGRLRLPAGTYLLDVSRDGRDRRLSFTVTQHGATVEVP